MTSIQQSDLDPPTHNTRPTSRGRRKPQVEPRNPPVWPLAELDGRAPVVLPATYAKPRGIELAYARESGDLSACPIGTPNGTADHVMPPFTPALSVGDGEIVYAGKLADSYAIVINHLNGWSSYYANLEHMFATPTDRIGRRLARVKSGDVLGYVGGMYRRDFKCLYFELWRSEENVFVPVDPIPFMTDWLRLPWPSNNPGPTAAVAVDRAA